MLTWALTEILNSNEPIMFVKKKKKKKSDLENVGEHANSATIGFGFARMVLAKLAVCQEGRTYAW